MKERPAARSSAAFGSSLIDFVIPRHLYEEMCQALLQFSFQKWSCFKVRLKRANDLNVYNLSASLHSFSVASRTGIPRSLAFSLV